MVRTQALEADRTAQLSDAVVGALQELQLFKLWVPKRYDGLELDLPRTLHIYEAAARIDGALGWAVMIGAGGGLFAAYLEPQAANELFAPPGAVVAGSGAPTGRAERVPNGYRAAGRWRYASGARYATVFTANCIVTHNGAPQLDSDGNALIRAMSFDPSNVTVIPTWNATGMRGTGSHDIEVSEVFVPAEHTFSVFTDPARESGALYRLSFDVLTQLPVAAVGAGIARHALDVFAALASTKKVPGSDATLAEDSAVRSRYSESHARWLSVHLALHSLATRVWETVVMGASQSTGELAEIAAACALFLSELEVAVGSLSRIAGMNAVLHDEELARAWRDLQTLSAHVSVSPLQHANAGRELLRLV